MTTKHYRIGLRYVGAYGGPDDSDITAEPPAGAVETPAPNRGDDVWNMASGAWDSSMTPAERKEAGAQSAVAEDMATPLVRAIINRLGDEAGFRADLLAEHRKAKA